MAHTTVTFRGDGFNTSEVKDYFINPGCFGDDVARWLVERLQGAGIKVDPEVGQEDFGWYFSYEIASRPYDVVVLYREDGQLWIAHVERGLGILGTIFGGRHRRIDPAACLAIHRALADSGRARDVTWHDHAAFKAGDQSSGRAQP